MAMLAMKNNWTVMNPDPGVDEFPCGICKKMGVKFCSNCIKICYCSVGHQTEDWVRHKPECRQYPIKFKKEDQTTARKVLVASKKIGADDVIFKERSIISGPYAQPKYRELTIKKALHSTRPKGQNADDDDQIKPVCLSCYQHMSTCYFCSKCQWPVCGPDCEEASVHSAFECKLFSERGVKPGFLVTEISAAWNDIYDFILCIRVLLLRQMDPAKWLKLMNIHTFSVIRKTFPEKEALLRSAILFIQCDCGMLDIEAKFITRVIDLVAQNSRGNNALSDPCASSTARFLYHDLAFLTRKPKAQSNCRLIENAVSKSETEVVIVATRDIQSGEQLLVEDVAQHYIITSGGEALRYPTIRRMPHETEEDFNVNILETLAVMLPNPPEGIQIGIWEEQGLANI